MRKEIALCDKCYEDTAGDVQTVATVMLQLIMNESYALAIDLCESHASGMNIAEVIESATPVASIGNNGPGKHVRDKIRCRFCNKPYSEGSGMALHVKKAHPEEYNRHKVIV